MQIFPDHWNGWQKGAVILIGVVFVFWGLSMASDDVQVPAGEAGTASTTASRTRAVTKQPSTYEVRYIITTRSAQYVDLVYNNATGGTEQRDGIQISGYKPTEFTYQMERGEHAYVAIYTRHDASRTNQISCELLVNGQRIDFTEVSGPSALADCSGFVGRQ